MAPRESSYRYLPSSEPFDTINDEESEQTSLQGELCDTKSCNGLIHLSKTSALVLGIMSCLTLVMLFTMTIMLAKGPSELYCAKQLSTHSPMMEAVEYEERNFKNEFRQPSIYRGEPTVELEDAWDKLWRFGDFSVPEDQISSYYSSDIEWRRTPAEFGGGVAASAEVFHQLHCLNMVRQYTWLDHYNVPPEGLNDSKLARTHVDHCIETLRMELMCAGDVTPVPIMVDKDAPLGAQAVFSTRHKCRKFGKLAEWAQAHSVE